MDHNGDEQKLAIELTHALGLDPHQVQHVRISIGREGVIVEVEYRPEVISDGPISDIASTLYRCKLVPVEEIS